MNLRAEQNVGIETLGNTPQIPLSNQRQILTAPSPRIGQKPQFSAIPIFDGIANQRHRLVKSSENCT